MQEAVMRERTNEPNGKASVVGESEKKPDPTAAAPWQATSAAARAIPFADRGVSMAERQREVQHPKAAGEGASINISLEGLLKLVGYVLALGAMWWSLRSDLRDIRTTMTLQNQLQDQRWEMQDERWQKNTEAMAGLDRKWQLQQYDLGEIKLALAKAGIYSEVKIQGQGPNGGGNGR